MLDTYWEIIRGEGRFWLDGYGRLEEQAAPDKAITETVPANNLFYYAKDSGGISTFCIRNDSQVEICFPTGAGGGGVITGTGCTGGVAFWTSAFSIGADCDNFNWNDTNNELIIGTTANPNFNVGGKGLVVEGTSPDAPAYHLFSFGTAGIAAQFRATVARGTVSSPTATQSGDAAVFSFTGHDGAFVNTAPAFIKLAASQAWTGSAHGTVISFETTPDGSTTRAERARITPPGDLFVNLTSKVTGVGLKTITIREDEGETTLVNGGQLTLVASTLDNANNTLIRARGSLTSLTPPLSGDRLAAFNGSGQTISGGLTTNGAGLVALATENWSSTANGMAWIIETIANGSTTPTERVRVTEAGDVGIGATPDQGLDVRKEISIFGSSASLARLRLRGFYAASPSDPPVSQSDIMIVDTGAAQVLRVRYNDAGTVRVGDLALV